MSILRREKVAGYGSVLTNLVKRAASSDSKEDVLLQKLGHYATATNSGCVCECDTRGGV